jgi:ABC-type antimicrobial peptide transport system permease subunit
MLGRGLLLVGVGLLAGVSAAIAASRLVRGMLFEVTPYDSATYGVVLLALAALSLLAVYVPARRATRIDPMLVLRQE